MGKSELIPWSFAGAKTVNYISLYVPYPVFSIEINVLCVVILHYQAEHIIVYIGQNRESSRMVMRSFLLFRGSGAGLFYDLSAGDSCLPPHSPIDKS
jgi:hypothetical protein